MRIALVHDWLTGMRGGEKVLAELVRLFPAADIFTLFWKRGSVDPEIEARVKRTSFLDRLPRVAKDYRYYLPLYPAAIRSFDLSGYDLILSSSHSVAKGVRVPDGAMHVSYVYTPMRYLWETGSEYFHFGQGRRWKRAALAMVAPFLRDFDRRTAATVDFFIAISEHVRDRIQRTYGAEAQVIPPPADTDFFTPADAPVSADGGYYFLVSALEPYKRIDLAVDAFAGGTRRLLVAGTGTLERQLRESARPPVEFLGAVPAWRLRELYRHCRALIFPGLEDFGIVMVEAQACGRPVVCYGAGGALETVVEGVTGVHFRPQTKKALLDAVERLEQSQWNSALIRQNSLNFARERFRQRMQAFCRSELPFDCGFDEQRVQDRLPAAMSAKRGKP